MEESSQEKSPKSAALVILEMPRQLHLSDPQRALLQRVFASMAKVQIVTEFTDGRTNTRVLLVRATRLDGRTELPVVVKMGHKTQIDHEWHATQEHILNLLPGFVPVQGAPIELADIVVDGQPLSAIRYAQVGDGIFTIQSLRDYYHQADIRQLWHLLDQRLFTQLRQLWQATLVRKHISIQQSYEAILPVNFIIQVQDTVPPADSVGVVTLNAESLPAVITNTMSLQVGDWVQLVGFSVQEIDHTRHEITLDLTASTSNIKPSYRIRLQAVEMLESYYVSEHLPPIVGKVLATRSDLLHAQVEAQLDKGVDLTESRIRLAENRDVTVPNPLVLLPTLLSRTIEANCATIHGDLNLRNILVDSDARSAHLIDGAAARHDYLLHDLLRLERDVMTDLVAETFFQANLPPTTTLMLYHYVHCAISNQPRPSGNFAIPSELPPILQGVFIFLVTIREAARKFLINQERWDEYYIGLCIHLLGALKFKDLDNAPTGQRPKAIAFWGAASVAGILAGEVSCREISWAPLDLRQATRSEDSDKRGFNREAKNSRDNLDGDISLRGNQSVRIQGDVISGGTVNQTSFHGPVTGPVHTGSGDIHVHPSQTVESSPTVITNVWYSPKVYGFWAVRTYDIGTLEIRAHLVTFRGRKHQFQITKIQSVTHEHMPGDLNNNWVKVAYLNEKGVLTVAFFADATKLGVGNLVGGSEEIFQALYAFESINR